MVLSPSMLDGCSTAVDGATSNETPALFPKPANQISTDLSQPNSPATPHPDPPFGAWHPLAGASLSASAIALLASRLERQQAPDACVSLLNAANWDPILLANARRSSGTDGRPLLDQAIAAFNPRSQLGDPMVLEGGAITRVVRAGPVVRREAGPWSKTVHLFLKFLWSEGFRGIPFSIGLDGEGDHVLGYVPGSAPNHPNSPTLLPETLIWELGALLRAYHEMSSRYSPPIDALWQRMPGVPASNEVIGHNDLFADNIVLKAGRPVALIDFDFAAPVPALLDLAGLAIASGPLIDSDRARSLGWPNTLDPAARVRLLCDAYGAGNTDRSELLRFVMLRHEVRYRTHQALSLRSAGFRALVDAGSLEETHRDIAWCQGALTRLRRSLR